MRLLLAGEDRDGALLRSLEHGLRERCDLVVVDPAVAVTRRVYDTRWRAKVHRRAAAASAANCLVEAIEQLTPDVTVIVKGRGVEARAVLQARSMSRVAIYYPDNPFWRSRDSGDVLGRLAAADLAIVWSTRLAGALESACRHVAVVPFGYDERWFPLADPRSERDGVVFMGTCHARRERYLLALRGLPVMVVGTGWRRRHGFSTAGPTYGRAGGELFRSASIALNIYHPQSAGAHNMRTREIAASGAFQITDPGEDGTPLRDGEGCRWFRSPGELRELVEWYLERRDERIAMAERAQELVAAETYELRACQVLEALRTLA